MARPTSAHLQVLPPVPPIEGDLLVPGADPIDFRWYLIERGLAPPTVRGYMAQMLRADAWCEERGYPLPTVPGPVIAEYADTLPKSQPSRRTFRTTMRHYWTMHERPRPPLWAIRVPRKPRMVCRALTPEEARRLAEHAATRGDSAGLAVLVGIFQGLRRLEIAALRWADVSDDGWLSVLGKGDQPAKIPVHPAVATALEKLPRTDPVWVFPGRFEGHATGATVWNWVRAVADAAGIGVLSPHRLRHTCLATALDATGDLRAVRDFARHASVETTQGYTRTTEKRLRAVMEAIRYEDDQ